MKLIETVTNRKSDFVFKTLAGLTGFTLWNESVGSSMDRIYLSNRSGEKPASVLVEDDYENDVLDLTDLANIIWNTYKNKWTHLFDDLQTEYVWDKNYSYKETETIDLKHTRDLDRSDSGETSNTTNTATNIETTDKVAAYNSGLKDATQSTTIGLKNGNETEESGSSSSSGTEDETKTEAGTRIREKEGVMGVPLTELLKNDFRFWQNTSLLNIIFNDVDKLLTLPYYE